MKVLLYPTLSPEEQVIPCMAELLNNNVFPLSSADRVYEVAVISEPTAPLKATLAIRDPDTEKSLPTVTSPS